jgi:hypothetical protein
MKQILTLCIVGLFLLVLFPYNPVVADTKITGSDITFSSWNLGAYYGGTKGPYLSNVKWNNHFMYTIMNVPYVTANGNSCSMSSLSPDNYLKYIEYPLNGFADIVLMYSGVSCTGGGTVNVNVHFYLFDSPNIITEIEVQATTAKSFSVLTYYNADLDGDASAQTNNYAYLTTGASDDILDSVYYNYETSNIVDQPDGGYLHSVILTYDGLTASHKLYIYDNMYNYDDADNVWEKVWVNKFTTSNQYTIAPSSYSNNDVISGGTDIQVCYEEQMTGTSTDYWFGSLTSLS